MWSVCGLRGSCRGMVRCLFGEWGLKREASAVCLGVVGKLTAPQEPHDLVSPSEEAPHLGQLDPCMLLDVDVSVLWCCVAVKLELAREREVQVDVFGVWRRGVQLERYLQLSPSSWARSGVLYSSFPPFLFPFPSHTPTPSGSILSRLAPRYAAATTSWVE